MEDMNLPNHKSGPRHSDDTMMHGKALRRALLCLTTTVEFIASQVGAINSTEVDHSNDMEHQAGTPFDDFSRNQSQAADDIEMSN
jgi:hypothetical protein